MPSPSHYGFQEPYSEDNMHGVLLGILGAVFAITLCGLGSAYGMAKASVALAPVSVMNPKLIMKAILPTIMAGIIAIYGLVVSVLITSSIRTLGNKYKEYNGYNHLGAGIAVGVCGLGAGLAIGVVGDCGIRGYQLQGSLYIGMLLVLIFAEVLGLYGLIVAVIFFAIEG